VPVRLRRRRGPAIDLHGAPGFRSSRRRATVLRVVFAAAAVGCLAAAAVSARGLDSRAPGILPSGSANVVVLDLSLSISEGDYPRIARAVRRLIDQNAPSGLVVFSDTPYELLPPGTPARELRPLLRLLTVSPGKKPENPWAGTFRLGTVISAALELAAGMLQREHAENGSILLVSDLETAPDDVPKLSRVLRDLGERGIAVRVVPLSPSSGSTALFADLLGPDAFAEPARASQAEPRRSGAPVGGSLPGAVLVLGALALLALAAHERFAARLALPRPARGSA
jgi:hypothetical protein